MNGRDVRYALPCAVISASSGTVALPGDQKGRTDDYTAHMKTGAERIGGRLSIEADVCLWEEDPQTARSGAEAAAMTRQSRCGCVSVLLPKARDRCVRCANLRYNRANETAVEGHDGRERLGGGINEAGPARFEAPNAVDSGAACQEDVG